MKFAAVLLLVTLLQACANPAVRVKERAKELGFSPMILEGKGFKLEAFAKNGTINLGVLHVYLEGDGLAWASPEQVSADPTPRNPLMLNLMAQDRYSSLYLGRPCYNGHADDPGCSPLLWTHRRYGPEIVDAMEDALRRHMAGQTWRGLVFLGHSGGGALALLLAPRFAETRAVLTVAANADIHAWVELHDYSPLQGSLNPADVVGGSFPEFHYLGERDANIPPAVFLPILQQRPRAQVYSYTGFGHQCCWDSVWPEILTRLP